MSSPDPISPQRAPRPVRRLRARLFEGYLAATLIATIVLGILASTSAYFSIDLTISLAVQSLRWPPVLALMRLISWFGFLPQSILVTGAVLAVLWRAGYRKTAYSAAATAMLSLAVNTVLKVLFHRPRPDATLVEVFDQLSSYSYPSGHVMYYTAFFGFLWYLAYTQLSSSALRSLALGVSGSLVLLVGVSRIYLGDHWASDVLAGYLTGSLVLAAGVWGFRRISREAES